MTQAARPWLAPLVPLYRLGIALRGLGLRSGLEPGRRLGAPVVSIGNLSTGGSGKTPLTIALARALTQRGLHVDVLSRGYGRTGAAVARVDPNGIGSGLWRRAAGDRPRCRRACLRGGAALPGRLAGRKRFAPNPQHPSSRRRLPASPTPSPRQHSAIGRRRPRGSTASGRKSARTPRCSGPRDAWSRSPCRRRLKSSSLSTAAASCGLRSGAFIAACRFLPSTVPSWPSAALRAPTSFLPDLKTQVCTSPAVSLSAITAATRNTTSTASSKPRTQPAPRLSSQLKKIASASRRFCRRFLPVCRLKPPGCASRSKTRTRPSTG